MAISPWEGGIYLKSPDKKKYAIVEFASEIAMGGPTRGTLRLSNGMIIDDCNPSIIWSEDSKFLAAPRWTEDRMQKLIFIDVLKKRRFSYYKIFSVLKLYSFKNNILKAIDSPLTNKEKIEIDISSMLLK